MCATLVKAEIVRVCACLDWSFLWPGVHTRSSSELSILVYGTVGFPDNADRSFAQNVEHILVRIILRVISLRSRLYCYRKY